MPLLIAATATAPDRWLGWLLLVGFALVAVVGYAVACFIWPFKPCRRCEGNGKHRSPSGKAWRLCRRCRGTGARIRIGRRLANWVIARRREA